MNIPAGNGDTVHDAMPQPKWHIGHVVSNLMEQVRPEKLTQEELAIKAGVGRNTVGAMLRGETTPDPTTVEKIAAVLNTTRHVIEAEAQRLKGETNVLQMPRRADQKEREEDHDPDLFEAIQYGKRIARLPRIARLALFNTVQAFEEAAKSKP